MTETTKKKSQLIPIGILLVLLAIAGPGIIIRFTSGGQLTLPIALFIDLLRLLFFVGIAFIIIGWLRNRKNRKTETT
jgi:hypothetical protein